VIERSACPTCGSCSGMFTANSMNCLTEALGLALPGNGSTLATHADRKRLFVEAGHLIVDLAALLRAGRRACCRATSRASRRFENAMTLDIAMGGSTNTVLHCWPPRMRPRSISPWPISTGCRAACPCCARSRPPSRQRPYGGRPPRRRHHGDPRRTRPRRPDQPRSADRPQRDDGRGARSLGHHAHQERERARASTAPRPAACRRRSPSARTAAGELDLDREGGVIRDKAHAFSRMAASPCSTATSRSTAAS
jgi:hypothetical protein